MVTKIKLADILFWTLFLILCSCTSQMSIQTTEESEYIDTIDNNIVVVQHKKVVTNNNYVYEVKVVKSVHDKFVVARYWGIENNKITFLKLFGPEDSTYTKTIQKSN